ncbi:hypothetical protein [Dictyobacter kobayashii]|uniref:hypothetical protein n=1 Tax=Dictyobacter kobayashii TaxID=2014872 RepID=UPI000F82F7D3|nr:hypothetical protein [Dictyobacter kobayashii]
MSTNKGSLLIISGTVVGAVAGTTSLLVRYVRQEIQRRGYPSWQECHCDFKTQKTIFQVWHSRHEQRGETIIAQEWGTYLVHPPTWIRYLLHHSTQTLAVLNPLGRYIERVTLTLSNHINLHRFCMPVTPMKIYLNQHSRKIHM